MTDPRTPRTEAGRALLEAGFGVYHHDACGYHDHTQRECDCSLPRRVRGIEAEASEDVRAAAWEAVRWLEYGTDRAEGDAATASRLRAILAADPTLSDPDAERQRAIDRLPIESVIRHGNVRPFAEMARADLQTAVEQARAALSATSEPT
jgi:hypothetical protein